MRKNNSRFIMCALLSVVIVFTMMPSIVFASSDASANKTKITTGSASEISGTEPVPVVNKKITVKLDAKKGKFSKKAKKSKTVTVGKKYGNISTPTKKGYKFRGWFLNGKKITKKSNVTIKKNHTLRAQWIKIGSGEKVSPSEYRLIRKAKGYSLSEIRTLVGAKPLFTRSFHGTDYKLSEWRYTKGDDKVVVAFEKGKMVWSECGSTDKIWKSMNKYFTGKLD